MIKKIVQNRERALRRMKIYYEENIYFVDSVWDVFV